MTKTEIIEVLEESKKDMKEENMFKVEHMTAVFDALIKMLEEN